MRGAWRSPSEAIDDRGHEQERELDQRGAEARARGRHAGLAGVATLVGATVAALSVAATWLAAAADPRLEIP